MSQATPQDFSRFRELVCMLLGGMSGFLIASPASAALTPGASLISTIAFTAAGVLVGYKRRHSSAFMYFALLCVLVLLSTYAYSLMQSHGG